MIFHLCAFFNFFLISIIIAENSKKEDNFGQNDDDWDVYKEIVSSVSVG